MLRIKSKSTVETKLFPPNKHSGDIADFPYVIHVMAPKVMQIPFKMSVLRRAYVSRMAQNHPLYNMMVHSWWLIKWPQWRIDVNDCINTSSLLDRYYSCALNLIFARNQSLHLGSIIYLHRIKRFIFTFLTPCWRAIIYC